jgi:hypothetical protein
MGPNSSGIPERSGLVMIGFGGTEVFTSVLLEPNPSDKWILWAQQRSVVGTDPLHLQVAVRRLVAAGPPGSAPQQEEIIPDSPGVTVRPTKVVQPFVGNVARNRAIGIASLKK